MSFRSRAASVLFGAYKYVLSPLLHAASGMTGACRFRPTCSEYAAIAVSEYGMARGGWLALRRLLRCHPLCGGGFDPVLANLARHVTRSKPSPNHSHAHRQLP